VPVDDPDHHHVVMREMLRGYRLNGRIARPSQVMIGEYADTSAQAAAPAHDPLLAVTEAAAAAAAAGALAAAATAPPAADPDAPRISEPDLGLSLDEIIARVEARDAEDEPPAEPEPAAVLYDDLSEIGEATLEPLESLEPVVAPEPAEDEIETIEADGTVDPSDWTKDD